LPKWPGLALELGSLLGAKLNAEIEHQTARESTVGPPKPLGSRGAKMAGTIGAAQQKQRLGGRDVSDHLE
jgi:hypothetical protein